VRKVTLRKVVCALVSVCGLGGITSSAQRLTTLVSFDGANGDSPFAPLVQGIDGSLYGTTWGGGGVKSCCGTVFKLTPEGTVVTLYVFCGQINCPDGEYPYGGLLQATDGNFYGTTVGGGPGVHGGTVFKITPDGQLTTLQSFCLEELCEDGTFPYSGLVQGIDGNFYGTTYGGGTHDTEYCETTGCGTVFKITPQGKTTILHSFSGYNTEGSAPIGNLLLGSNGNFYGTTEFGGSSTLCRTQIAPTGCGTVFEITPSGNLTTLHSFSLQDGAMPIAGLVQGLNGNFYGTTSAGGTGGGTVFEMTPTGLTTTIYNFCPQNPCQDGVDPQGTLIQATDGNLYGAATRGGVSALGSIFKITLDGVLTTLHSFCAQGYPYCPDGSSVTAGVLQATDGALYGTTALGGIGPYGFGTLFSFSTGLGRFVSFLRNPAKPGQMFGILGKGLKGSIAVSLNNIPATFSTRSDTLIVATVPAGATTGYVIVTTPTGTLTSNKPFYVIP